MIYGYARISTPKQSIMRQVRNILAFCPDALIIQEVFSRNTLHRKEWPKLFKKVKSGDTIIFDSVSRMSGNAAEGFAAYEELYTRGVNLVFLKERHIDTDTYKKAIEQNISLTGSTVDYILDGINKYLLSLAQEQIRIAFMQSQKEIEDLHQRTKEGIETARLNGKQIGRIRGKKYTTKKEMKAKDIILRNCKDFGGSNTDAEVIKIAGISRNTFYKYKAEIKNVANLPHF